MEKVESYPRRAEVLVQDDSLGCGGLVYPQCAMLILAQFIKIYLNFSLYDRNHAE